MPSYFCPATRTSIGGAGFLVTAAFRQYTSGGTMRRLYLLIFLVHATFVTPPAQSGRVVGYSESGPTRIARPTPSDVVKKTKSRPDETEVIRVLTDLVTIPVRIAAQDGKPVTGVQRGEFKIFENGI